MTYRPDQRWQIDRNRDGTWATDVTDDAFDWQVDVPNSVLGVGTARGRIQLNNPAGRYDSFPRDRQLPIRLIAGATAEWEGVCQMDASDAAVIDTATLRLFGKHTTTMSAQNRRLVHTGSGSVADLAAEFRRLSGAPLSLDWRRGEDITYQLPGERPQTIENVYRHFQSTGNVVHVGDWFGFLANLGVYCGGPVVETHVGGYQLVNWAATADAYEPPHLDAASFGPLAGQRVIDAEGDVRNTAQVSATWWDDAEDVELLVSRPVVVRRGERVRIVLDYVPGQGSRASQWLYARISDYDNAFLENLVRRSDGTASVTVGAYAFSQQEEFTVTVEGHGIRGVKRNHQPQPMTVTDNDSVAVHGVKELRVPPWAPESLRGGEFVTRPWLRNLSTPPRYIETAYQEWTDTQAQYETLAAITPGRPYVVDVVANDQVTPYTCVCLGMRLSGGHRRIPERRLLGLEVRRDEGLPLRVGAVDVGDRAATIRVTRTTHAYETIWVRWRRRGTATWLTASVTADSDTPTHRVGSLTANTLYDVQAADNEQFTDPATGSFRTTRTPVPNLRLDRVEYQLTGTDGMAGSRIRVPDWDHTLSDVHSLDLLLDGLYTVRVFAVAEDSSAQVTVSPANRQNAANNSRIQYTITVTKDGLSRRHTLFLSFRAPVDNEFGAVPTARTNIQRWGDIHSDGETMWVIAPTANSGGNIRAYNQFTKGRDTSREWSPFAANRVRAITGTSTHLYVTDGSQWLRAYNKADLTRASGFDINTQLSGIEAMAASEARDRIYLTTFRSQVIRAVSISQRNRQSPDDFTATRPRGIGRSYPEGGIAVVGETVYVGWVQGSVGGQNSEISAIDALNERGVPEKHIVLADDNDWPSGLATIEGNTELIWCYDRTAGRIFSYSLRTLQRAATSGATFTGSKDINGLRELGLTRPVSGHSDGTTTWILHAPFTGQRKCFGFDTNTGLPDPSQDFNVDNDAVGVTGAGSTLWILRAGAFEMKAYNRSNKRVDASKTFAVGRQSTPADCAASGYSQIDGTSGTDAVVFYLDGSVAVWDLATRQASESNLTLPPSGIGFVTAGALLGQNVYLVDRTRARLTVRYPESFEVPVIIRVG